jgi:hypothetical protein
MAKRIKVAFEAPLAGAAGPAILDLLATICGNEQPE